MAASWEGLDEPQKNLFPVVFVAAVLAFGIRTEVGEFLTRPESFIRWQRKEGMQPEGQTDLEQDCPDAFVQQLS